MSALERETTKSDGLIVASVKMKMVTGSCVVHKTRKPS